MLLIFAILQPIIIVTIPPVAKKLLNISGDIKGWIKLAVKYIKLSIINCGILIIAIEMPTILENNIAVATSNTVFDNKTLMSPVNPSFNAPNIPNPLTQKTTLPYLTNSQTLG